MRNVVRETLECQGHENILGTHLTTIELTKKPVLTQRGNCIVGVGATKSLRDFNQEFKTLARQPIDIKCILRIHNQEVIITGKGHLNLTYTHPTDIVIRKSSFTCPRTVMIRANKTAKNLPREFIKLLQNPETKLECEFTIQP